MALFSLILLFRHACWFFVCGLVFFLTLIVPENGSQGPISMTLCHVVVLGRWQRDADVGDSAQPWHHPCAQDGTNLLLNPHLCARRNTVYPHPCS